ncbi:baseplate J/gp47 family protein [Desulfovibrio sp. OttesenSCG-928-G15]|nr:baseplate J/gp47 family protein [Desulfovibrio sp. OttesenSCG-928-G15]
MAYDIPDFEGIRTDYLQDVRNLDDAADITPDSDNFVRASATSSAVDGLYRHQEYLERQILPDTADPDKLEQHAALRGMALKPATKASGNVQIIALDDTVPAFAAGTALVYVPEATEAVPAPEEVVFVTTEAWVGGSPEGGVIVLACEAQNAGALPDLTGVAVTLRTAPGGVDTDALLYASGGTDKETHGALLARLLFYMRNPPGAANKAAYERWCLAVPGITWAKCLPIRRGLGTVDVVCVSGDAVPPAALVAKVAAHVDTQLPEPKPDCLILAPAVKLTNITVNVKVDPLSGVTLPMLQPRVEAALAVYFAALLPGDGVIVAKLIVAILDVPGVLDVDIITPAGNIPAHDITWPRLGAVTLGAM